MHQSSVEQGQIQPPSTFLPSVVKNALRPTPPWAGPEFGGISPATRPEGSEQPMERMLERLGFGGRVSFRLHPGLCNVVREYRLVGATVQSTRLRWSNKIVQRLNKKLVPRKRLSNMCISEHVCSCCVCLASICSRPCSALGSSIFVC